MFCRTNHFHSNYIGRTFVTTRGTQNGRTTERLFSSRLFTPPRPPTWKRNIHTIPSLGFSRLKLDLEGGGLVAAAVVGFGLLLLSDNVRKKAQAKESERETSHVPQVFHVIVRWLAYLKETLLRMEAIMLEKSDPIFMKGITLLPPRPPAPFFAKEATLVLDIDLLVTHEYTEGVGWATYKRPGCDLFLATVTDYFEVVVFSDRSFWVDNMTMEGLDPNLEWIEFRLFQESARRNRDGVYIKDLTYLGRDMRKVIMLETKKHNIDHCPTNVISVPPFDPRKSDDNTLPLLRVWLLALASYCQEVKDIRSFIKHINQDRLDVVESLRLGWIEEGMEELQALLKKHNEMSLEEREDHFRMQMGGILMRLEQFRSSLSRLPTLGNWEGELNHYRYSRGEGPLRDTFLKPENQPWDPEDDTRRDIYEEEEEHDDDDAVHDDDQED